MDIRQLRYFVSLCELGNFSAAAQKLYLTPQALSKSIKRMEEELGVQLLLRNNDGVELTRPANRLLEGAHTLIAQFDTLLADTQQLAGHQTTLQISLSYGVMVSVLYDFVAAFRTKYPHITLNIDETSDINAEHKVLEHTAQMGFSIGLPVEVQKFHAVLIKREPLYFFAHAEHPLARQRRIEIADLKGQKLCSVTDDFKTFHMVANMCRQQGFEPEYAVKTMDLTLVGYYLSINKGISIGPGTHHLQLQKQGIACLPFADSGMEWSVYLITKRGEDESSAQKLFKKELLAYRTKHFAG